MGSDVTIRPASLPGDVRRIQAFVKAEAEGLGFPDNEVYHRTDELVDAAGRPYDLFLLAEEGRALRGFAILTTGLSHSRRHVASLRIHLSDEARGKGLGSALLERAFEWAEERGVVRIEATPYVKSTDTGQKIVFFERHGFVLEGIGRKAARTRDGGFTDVALMARVA